MLSTAQVQVHCRTPCASAAVRRRGDAGLMCLPQCIEPCWAADLRLPLLHKGVQKGGAPVQGFWTCGEANCLL